MEARHGGAPSACPALALGAELGRVVTAYTTADEAAVTAYAAQQWEDHRRARTRHELLGDRMDHLEEAASFTPAASLEGALVQVMLAAAAAERFVVHDLTEDQVEEEGKRLRRLLYSIRGAIEAVSCPRKCEALGDFYMRRELDPFLGMQENA